MSSKLIREIRSNSSGNIVARVFDFNQITKTTFLSEDAESLQIGVAIENQEIRVVNRHFHKEVCRSINNTAEFLMVLRGSVKFKIYNRSFALLDEGELCENMALIQFEGGHSFEIAKGTIFFELKQGPYLGVSADKEYL